MLVLQWNVELVPAKMPGQIRDRARTDPLSGSVPASILFPGQLGADFVVTWHRYLVTIHLTANVEIH